MAAILSFEFQIKLYIRVHEYVGMDMEEGIEMILKVLVVITYT